MEYEKSRIEHLYYFLSNNLVGPTSGKHAEEIARLVCVKLCEENGYVIDDFEDAPWWDKYGHCPWKGRKSHGGHNK